MESNKANYTLILTHDIDHTSLRSYPVFSNMTVEFFKRCLWINLLRMIKGDIPFLQYLDSVKWCIVYPLVKMRLFPDPWETTINDIVEMENKYGVRSTFFFIPFKDKMGHIIEGVPAVRGRAVKYDVCDFKDLLFKLESNGWEVGVHGIDAHISLQSAKEEIEVIKTLLPFKEKIGVRMHWLYQSESLWKNLRDAGYYYDATFGSNDDVGFPNNKYQPFKKDGIWVIPLNIQEGTLLGYWQKEPIQTDPWTRIEEILSEAKEKKAAVTILWHNHSFGVYHYHGYLYEKILKKAKADGARICRCIDICEEMEARE
jgi:peptidoglycan/xylan/chitin deacetylase (PgdA/CDA1 family)